MLVILSLLNWYIFDGFCKNQTYHFLDRFASLLNRYIFLDRFASLLSTNLVKLRMGYLSMQSNVFDAVILNINVIQMF